MDVKFTVWSEKLTCTQQLGGNQTKCYMDMLLGKPRWEVRHPREEDILSLYLLVKAFLDGTSWAKKYMS